MPASSQLVESIRGKYPGVYDDLDDATLTKQVLAKYPQYSDLAAPPVTSAAKPNVNMQEVDTLGKPQNPASGYSGPGAWPNPEAAGKAGESNAYRAAVGGPIAGAAAVMGGGPMLPFLKQTAGAALKAAPYVAASEGINYARQKLPGGKFIPPGAELLPFFMGGGKGEGAKAAEAEQSASTDQAPGRPYMPNPRYEAPPEPNPLPARNGPLLLKGQVETPSVSKPVSMGKLPWMPELEKSLGNEPTQIKPGVPIKNQVTPRESSAVEAYHYDPDAREFHVKPKGGATGYIYGDVSPEDAQAFDGAESKGKAWQQMRNNTLVGKVVNGKRVNVKPIAREGNDLTDILTQSLKQAQSTGKQ